MVVKGKTFRKFGRTKSCVNVKPHADVWYAASMFEVMNVSLMVARSGKILFKNHMDNTPMDTN